VQYDHFSQGRFRHGTKFLRWRPDKPPKACTMDQVTSGGAKLDLLEPPVAKKKTSRRQPTRT
jgi:hypothetical protein